MFNRLLNPSKAALSFGFLASVMNNLPVAAQEPLSSTGDAVSSSGINPGTSSHSSDIDSMVGTLIIIGAVMLTCYALLKIYGRRLSELSNNAIHQADAERDGDEELAYSRMAGRP